MAHYHEREESRYCCYRYATARYPQRKESARNIYQRCCSGIAQLCRRKRTYQYQAKTGGGNSSSESKGCKVRQTTITNCKGFLLYQPCPSISVTPRCIASYMREAISSHFCEAIRICVDWRLPAITASIV